VAAKGYATKAVEAGRMSPATEHGIDARANKELGHSGRHGGILSPHPAGRMGHSAQSIMPVKSDRGSFKIKA